MKHLYQPGLPCNPPRITNALPDVLLLHRMLRVTLIPKIGDATAMAGYERNLIDAIRKDAHFNVFDFIIQEIWNIVITPNRACAYAPYIMSMIEHVSKRTFVKDVVHQDLKPQIPSAASRPPPTASTSSSTGRSGVLKFLKGIFAMCQRTQDTVDSVRARQNVLLENQCNLHRLTPNAPAFVEFAEEPVPPPVADPFSSLTPQEMTYFGFEAKGDDEEEHDDADNDEDVDAEDDEE